MLPIDLNSGILKSYGLSDSDKLKNPNLALCKELIFSCTKNKSSDSMVLMCKDKGLCSCLSCSQNIRKSHRKHSDSRKKINPEDLEKYIGNKKRSFSESSKTLKKSPSQNKCIFLKKLENGHQTKKKSMKSQKPLKKIKLATQKDGFVKNKQPKCVSTTNKQIVQQLKSKLKNLSNKELLKLHNLTISLDKGAKPKNSRKHSDSRINNCEKLIKKLKHSGNKKVSRSKISKTLKEPPSLNKCVSLKKFKNGQSKRTLVKSQKHSKNKILPKSYKKNLELLKTKLKHDSYGEKLLNILENISSDRITPSTDKRLKLIVCLLSMVVCEKYKVSEFDKLVNNDSDKPNLDTEQMSILKKRIVSIRRRLENSSFPKYKEEKKYLVVSLKKLPDCIFNHVRKHNASTFSELPDYMCNSCITTDVRIVIYKLPDKIIRNYEKGKPIMISNLPLSLNR